MTDRDDGKPLKKQYFTDISPPAVELGFENTTAFRITRHPISGHYFPRVLAIASWPGDWQQRQAHFEQLQRVRPNIAARRFDIWSTFNMLNFEITQDVDVAFNPDKVYVFGAYWRGESTSSPAFTAMVNNISKAGGNVVFKHDTTYSMFGYASVPDFAMITEWDCQQDFDLYYQQMGGDHASAMQYSSELYLDIRR